MRIIKGIDETIKCVDPSYPKEGAPTYKKIILDSLHMDRGDGVNAMRSVKLGLYIYEQKNNLKLEDDNFNFIHEKVKKNPARYPNFALGDLLMKLEGAEDEKL